MADGPLHPPLTPVKPSRAPVPVARLAAKPPLQGHRARPFLQGAAADQSTAEPDEAS